MVRISREKQQKKYIKEELMRYHFYLEKEKESKAQVEDFIIIRREIINDPPIGGSFARLPDGTPDNSNIVIRLDGKLNDLESDYIYYKNQVKAIKNWIGVLTEKQAEVAKIYICEYQCENIHEASLELGYAEDTLKHAVDPILERIRRRVNKIM